MKFPRPCIDCGQLGEPGETRCPTHKQRIDNLNEIRRTAVKKTTKQYSGAYQRLAKYVRANTIVCAICGEGARWNDPWEADHINPSTEVKTITDLQGVHSSCNKHKSNKQN